jgi:hypothetical protein
MRGVPRLIKVHSIPVLTIGVDVRTKCGIEAHIVADHVRPDIVGMISVNGTNFFGSIRNITCKRCISKLKSEKSK